VDRIDESSRDDTAGSVAAQLRTTVLPLAPDRVRYLLEQGAPYLAMVARVCAAEVTGIEPAVTFDVAAAETDGGR
jgi:hypothetical protein